MASRSTPIPAPLPADPAAATPCVVCVARACSHAPLYIWLRGRASKAGKTAVTY